MMETLCNVRITDKHKSLLLNVSEDLQILIPMNAECFVKGNQDVKLLSFINSCRTTIDGQIPIWLFKLKYKGMGIEKLSGSDIIYDYCHWAEKEGFKVFFLGGKEVSNEEGVKKMKELFPNLTITGYSPPYEPYPFTIENTNKIQKILMEFKPDILFVGFGFGKQERWVADNQKFLESISTKWAICCGGSFEFISGEIKRAPKFISNIGMEGFWRLIMEPKLFRIKRLITSLKILKYAY